MGLRWRHKPTDIEPNLPWLHMPIERCGFISQGTVLANGDEMKSRLVITRIVKMSW